MQVFAALVVCKGGLLLGILLLLAHSSPAGAFH